MSNMSFLSKCKKSILIFMLLAVFVLTACSEVVQPEAEITVEDEKPVAGGTINMASVEPGTLNPLLSKSKSYMEVSKLLFQNLVEYDQNLKIVSALAESWSFEAGTSKCVVRLKNNIYWSDGQDVTADDVIFSMDTIKTSADSIYKSHLEHVYSYKARDSKTIEIVFDQPFANAFDMLNFPIIPQHVYSKDINAVPVGTGPFKVSQYDKLKSMELVYNEKWNGQGKPYIDKVKVTFISDTDAFSTAFQSKELDILNTTSYDWEKYSEMKDVNAYKYTTLNYDFLGLNYKNPIFTDKAVRKAMIQGINRKSIVEKYLLGNAEVTDVPISPVSWLNDGKGITYEYSKVEAQNTLKAAGFVDSNNDGILEREVDGVKQTLKFTLLTNEENDFRKKAADDIKKNLEEIGFSVEIKSLPFNDVKTALDSKQFDVVLTGYSLSNTQDLSFAFHTSQIAGGKNFMSYSNPDFDNLLQQAYVTLDSSQRKEVYTTIQQTFREEVPCISLFFRDAAVVVRNKIRGDIKPDVINPYRNIYEWFIPQNKQ
ncbi:MAG: peptide ABC transporter substrate-binding protein [Caulobacteraceae bacterium]